jgi:hypothetical protein
MADLDYELLNRAIMRQGGNPLPVPSAMQTPLDVPTTDALDGAMGMPLGAEAIPVATGAAVAQPISTEVTPQELVPATTAEPLPTQPIRTVAPDAPVVHRPPELRQTPAAPPPEPPPAQPAAPNLGTADGYGIDETMRSLDELTTAQAEAAMRTGEAEAKAGERKGAAGNQYAREVDEISKKHATQEAASAEMYQRTMDEFRAMNAAIAAMPAPHDRRNRGERFWGMFATALSDQGGKNVQDGINRDIQLQQNELDNKRKDSNAKLTELGIAREFIQDQRAATQFAAGLRKERFAGEMEAAAGELAAGTSRDKALQVAAQYKVEARQQQLGILKSVMGGKMNALEAAMMVKLGVMSPAEARAAMGVGAGGANGDGAAAAVPGKLTKGDASKVNLTAYQNETPGGPRPGQREGPDGNPAARWWLPTCAGGCQSGARAVQAGGRQVVARASASRCAQSLQHDHEEPASWLHLAVDRLGYAAGTGSDAPAQLAAARAGRERRRRRAPGLPRRGELVERRRDRPEGVRLLP